jgi:phage gp36-like protein
MEAAAMAISYCTIEDVLFNHARIPDTVDERAAITMFIELAEGKINDKLRGKYTVPFATVPATIREVCMNLATAMELRRLAGANTSIQQDWIDSYKTDAQETLSEIAGCKINFDSDDVTPATLVDSNTLNIVKIFDLGDVYGQDYHDTDADERYGEDE